MNKIYLFKDLEKKFKDSLKRKYSTVKFDNTYKFSFYPTEEIFYEVLIDINEKLEILYCNKFISNGYDFFEGIPKNVFFKRKGLQTKGCVFSASAINVEAVNSVCLKESACASNNVFMAKNISSNFFDSSEYSDFKENGFCNVLNNPLSTFSASVNTASYSDLRKRINDGRDVRNRKYRLDELINYFDYNYKIPKKDNFSVDIKIMDSDYSKNKLCVIGVKAKELDYSETSGSNLVFLIDVSGSMYSDDKLPLLKDGFIYFVNSLNPEDTVSIVTYSGKEEIVLDGEKGKNKKKIIEAINKLEANGCTNGEAGLKMAYEMARKHFKEKGNNRIIMCSDGDLNVGIRSQGELQEFVTREKQSGVYLTVLGFGTGNYKDDKMETLANCGNGNYYYIDNVIEAQKVLCDKISSTLVTIADDVKFQVEFNPKYIKEYKLIGYETKRLNTEDFKNDDVDGGDVGYGHSVTVVYEIVENDGHDSSVKLKYQDKNIKDSDEYLNVKIRYKVPGKDKHIEKEYPLTSKDYLINDDDNAKFIKAVIDFGLLINGNESIKIDSIIDLLNDCKLNDKYKIEFLALVYKYKNKLSGGSNNEEYFE